MVPSFPTGYDIPPSILELGSGVIAQIDSGVGIGALPLYLLFLALPGLVFVKALIIADRRPDTLDRWDKLGYVLFGGIISALIVVGAYRLYRGQPIQSGNIGLYHLSALLTAVLLQSGVSVVLGIALGVAKYRFGDGFVEYCREGLRWISGEVGRKFNDRQEPWEYLIDNIREQEVKVVTKSGREIVGYAARFSSNSSRRTLVLSPVEPGQQEEIGPDDNETNAVYIHDANISRISFRDEEAEEEYSDVLPMGDIDPPGPDDDEVGQETSEK